jgi:hypothetical protein
MFGFVSGNLTNRLFRQWAYRHKLYGIDTDDAVKTFLVVIVTLIWFIANASSLYNGNAVDLSVHAIFGTIIGGYFGVQLLGRKK